MRVEYPGIGQPKIQQVGRDGTASGFLAAMRRVASTVAIVAATDGNRAQGMTVSAHMSVSIDPSTLAICVNRRTLIYDIALGARHFSVNFLGEEQAAVSRVFSSPSSGLDRFSQSRWTWSEDGMGILADASASLLCRKVAIFPVATHALLIGEVENVRVNDSVLPLLYLDGKYCSPAISHGSAFAEPDIWRY